MSRFIAIVASNHHVQGDFVEIAAFEQETSVIYLLHGGGGNFRDWSNYSDVAAWLAPSYILVMPEGHCSYYTNSAARPEDRCEDYITKDLACGEQEGLLVANNQFTAQLKKRGFQFEYHTALGNHDWAQSNSWLPALSAGLSQHFPAKE